jgi:molecular chaperone GrpE
MQEGESKRVKPASQNDSMSEAEGQQEQTLEELQQEVERLRGESIHNLDQWKRAAANLQNYRKRVEREREELVQLAHAPLMTHLLPVLDDFERAFATLPQSLRPLTWVDGIGLIERKLQMVLVQHGLQEIEAQGKTLDPTRHQSIMEEESDACPDGQVIEVLQKGYVLHDRVLRPAMVKIARNKAPEGETATERQGSESPGAAQAGDS